MVKNIMRDPLFLSQKSETATKEDLQIGRDLMDTLRANRERCVGMAANMIGVKKNIIIVNMGFVDIVMFNPVIVSKNEPFETEEGVCPWTEFVRRSDIRISKWNITILPGRNSARNYPAGLHRLYSMKWIICLEDLFRQDNILRINTLKHLYYYSDFGILYRFSDDAIWQERDTKGEYDVSLCYRQSIFKRVLQCMRGHS